MKEIDDVELQALVDMERRKLRASPILSGLAVAASMLGPVPVARGRQEEKPKTIDKKKAKRRAKDKAARKQRKMNR